ncbi:MAG: hypothetical protein V1494_04975, partial [Candidatus Diapherotrites archaeon]
TIKASLDFLSKQGVLEGFSPKINIRKFGYKLEAMVMLHADTSEKKVFEDFLERVKKDPHLYRLSAIMGSGNWNLMVSHLYRDIEGYHNNEQKQYYEAVPGIYKLIKDKQVFYATEPYYKNASRVASVIEIVRKEKGID